MRRSSLTMVVVAVALVGSSAALAQPVVVVPDVPTDLPDGGPTTFLLPWNLVRSDAGVYSLEESLTAAGLSDIKIDAAWEIYSDHWILSVESATELGGTTFRRSDIFSWNANANTFFLEESQDSAGIPDGSNLDAIFRDPQTDGLVLSFDTPTTVGGGTFQPADLVRYDLVSNTFNGAFFDASAFGIPDGTNLTAAQARGTVPCGAGICTRVIFSLDRPTTIGAATYLPGDLLSWDGTAITLFQSQPGWPFASQVNALSFDGAPGLVPPTIRVAKVDPTTLRILWETTPCSGLEYHGIYQGNIATVRTGTYDHVDIDCVDSGTQLQEDIPLPSGDRYFLVVPLSQTEEGSYGTDTVGDGVGPEGERPVGATTCESIQNLDEC